MELNAYIEDLRCLYYSMNMNTQTKRASSFMDKELTCHVLLMCLFKWQDQYHLLEKHYPEGVKHLLAIFECIEFAHPFDIKSITMKPSKS